MRKDAVLLGVLAVLALSHVGLVAVLLRGRGEAEPGMPMPAATVPSRTAAPSGASPAPAATDPAGLAARLGEIDARLAALTQEVRALGARAGAVPPADAPDAAESSADPASPAPASAVPVAATKMERMLQASQAVKKYWEEIEAISELRKAMDAAEYTALLLEKTAEFLKLDAADRPRFEEEMRQRIQAYETFQAEQRRMYETRSTGEGDSPEARKKQMAQWMETKRLHGERQKQFMQDARVQLGTILNAEDFGHKSFLTQLGSWLSYASRGNQGGWDD